MDRLYQDMLAFETFLGVRFDYVLHVGDFDIWADPSQIDKATRHHDDVGDFPAWPRENRGAPRPTLFIKGNQEDFVAARIRWSIHQLGRTRIEKLALPAFAYLSPLFGHRVRYAMICDATEFPAIR
jgi:hypothetical protein